MRTLFAIDLSWLPDGPTTLPMQVLTVVAFVAGGALFAGVLLQLVFKVIVRARAPGPAVNLVRLGGAGIAGFVAVLWLFQGPGRGPGLGPGKGPGEGGGSTDGTVKVKDDREANKDDKTKRPETAGKIILRIEVLGNITVRKLAGDEGVAMDRRFRIPTVNEKGLMTLGELKNYLSQQSRDGRLPDQLLLIFYKHDTRPRDKSLALNGPDQDKDPGLLKLAVELGKDRVEGGWIKSDILDQMPPS